MGETVAAPNAKETMQAYQQYLPSIMQEMSQQVPGVAASNLLATQQTQPAYNALNLQELQNYALPEAQIGQQVAQSNALAGANTNLAQLQGPGGQAAQAALNVNQATNPNYYTAQNAASTGAANAVNAINLGGLSPGETNAVERSLNATNQSTGNAGLINPLNTINNAMNFGGAYNSKIGLMNNAVNAASGAANSAAGNGGFNGVSVALGQPNTSTGANFGTGQFQTSSPTSNAGSQGNAFNFGSGLLGNMTSLANANTGAQASIANASSPASYFGSAMQGASGCCFIFLESYHGKLPKCIRKSRNI